MDQIESKYGSIAPADQRMAWLLHHELQRENNPHRSEGSHAASGFQEASSPSHCTTIAVPIHDRADQFTNNTVCPTDEYVSKNLPAPTSLWSGNTHPNGWEWACEAGKNTKRWCTVNPLGRPLDVITLLLRLDPETCIKIIPAYSTPWEQASQYWANEPNRSRAMNVIAKVMNTLKLSICLGDEIKSKRGNKVDDEEWLVRVGNSLAPKFGLDTVSVPSEQSPYHFVFRQAKDCDSIVTGHRYADRDTLIRSSTGKIRYRLQSEKQATGIFNQIRSVDESRVNGEVEE